MPKTKGPNHDVEFGCWTSGILKEALENNAFSESYSLPATCRAGSLDGAVYSRQEPCCLFEVCKMATRPVFLQIYVLK